MNVFDILDQIEAVKGKNDKLAILKANHSKQLQVLLNAALNFNQKFFIKKFNIPPTNEQISYDGHAAFVQLLDQLRLRILVGDEAKATVEQFLGRCNQQQQKWYSRILRKDLQAGFDISTANKAGFDIPRFEVMLAKDGYKCKNLHKIVQKGVYVSRKLDGYRCLAVVDKGNVTLHSRNGSLYKNFPNIIKELAEYSLQANISFVLDGEIKSNTFNNMQQSAFASKRGTTVGDVIYRVFGLIPFTEWTNNSFNLNMNERLQILNNLMSKANFNNIKIVKQFYTTDINKVYELQAQYEIEGDEGAMIINNMPYYKGRKSNKLLKLKSTLTQDCVIQDLYEGTNKYQNMLGGVAVRQENNVICKVGSGFSDDERKKIWTNPQSIMGRIIEVKYQEMTDEQRMRFPIFIRFRDKGDDKGKI